MGLYKFFPQPNDRMAELWALIPIEGCAILEYGPAGTTHFAIEGIGHFEAEKRCYLATTDIDGNDVALGLTERLEITIDEIAKNQKPPYLFVSASSVSSVIGTDIESICNMLQPNYSETKLIPLTSGGISGMFTKGLEEIFLKIVKLIVKPPKTKSAHKFNIIGSSIDDCYFNADSLEIIRIMQGAFNMECGCLFTSNCSINHIETMSEGAINIVIRKEGLKAAEYLKDNYNIPYVYEKPYGLEKTLGWIKKIADVLNLNLNEDFLNNEISLLKKQVQQIKRINLMRNRSCIISGNYDTVKGIEYFASQECGFKIADKWCDNQQYGDDDVPFRTEAEWIKIIKEYDGNLLLSDAIAISLANSNVHCHQISNPNLKRHLTYPYAPLVGFRGALYLLQVFFNIPSSMF